MPPTQQMKAFDAKHFKAEDCNKQFLVKVGVIFITFLFLLADVKELVNECVGGSELQQRKAKIQTYSDQTSSKLKKHVYDNYMQFIETAKEISRKHFLQLLGQYHCF